MKGVLWMCLLFRCASVIDVPLPSIGVFPSNSSKDIEFDELAQEYVVEAGGNWDFLDGAEFSFPGFGSMKSTVLESDLFKDTWGKLQEKVNFGAVVERVVGSVGDAVMDQIWKYEEKAFDFLDDHIIKCEADHCLMDHGWDVSNVCENRRAYNCDRHCTECKWDCEHNNWNKCSGNNNCDNDRRRRRNWRRRWRAGWEVRRRINWGYRNECFWNNQNTFYYKSKKWACQKMDDLVCGVNDKCQELKGNLCNTEWRQLMIAEAAKWAGGVLVEFALDIKDCALFLFKGAMQAAEWGWEMTLEYAPVAWKMMGAMANGAYKWVKGKILSPIFQWVKGTDVGQWFCNYRYNGKGFGSGAIMDLSKDFAKDMWDASVPWIQKAGKWTMEMGGKVVIAMAMMGGQLGNKVHAFGQWVTCPTCILDTLKKWAALAGKAFVMSVYYGYKYGEKVNDGIEWVKDQFATALDWWKTSSTAQMIRDIFASCADSYETVTKEWEQDPEKAMQKYMNQPGEIPSFAKDVDDYVLFSDIELKMAAKMADNSYFEGYDPLTFWFKVAMSWTGMDDAVADVTGITGWEMDSRPICWHQTPISETEPFSKMDHVRNICTSSGVGAVGDADGNWQELVTFQGRIKSCQTFDGYFAEVEGCNVVDIYFTNEQNTDDQSCYAVFRGSDDVADWEANFNIKNVEPHDWWTEVGDFLVWAGHNDFYLAVRDKVKQGCGSRPMITVGHSLGGAMAQISNAYGDAVKSIAFAAPRAFKLRQGKCALDAQEEYGMRRVDEQGVLVGLVAPSIHIYISDRERGATDPVPLVPMDGAHCSYQNIEFYKDKDGWANSHEGTPTLRPHNYPNNLENCGLSGLMAGQMRVDDAAEACAGKEDCEGTGVMDVVKDFFPSLTAIGLHRMKTGIFPALFSGDYNR